MPPWQQDFDVYLAMIEELPASFVVDLAAAQHAPLASHPLLLTIRVEMLMKRDDGLRHADELDALGELEDQFCDALEDKVQSIYIGRVVHDGHTTMFFYVPAAHRASLDNLPTLTGAPPDGYTPGWAVADDPGWDHYTGFMAPDVYAMQSIQNRRLVAIFTDEGDVLSAEREVDHLAFFASQAQAEGASAALRSAGFATDPVEPPANDRGWGLQFHRADALADGRPDDFVTEIFELIDPFEGHYDGWGAVHVKPN